MSNSPTSPDSPSVDDLDTIVEFVGDWDQQIVATSIHAGHDVRPELAELMVLPTADRTREEDPHTDRLAAVAPARVITHRSRFETDLNRPRREAVYRKPDDCWGLEVWKGGELPALSDPRFSSTSVELDEEARTLLVRRGSGTDAALVALNLGDAAASLPVPEGYAVAVATASAAASGATVADGRVELPPRAATSSSRSARAS